MSIVVMIARRFLLLNHLRQIQGKALKFTSSCLGWLASSIRGLLVSDVVSLIINVLGDRSFVVSGEMVFGVGGDKHRVGGLILALLLVLDRVFVI